MADRVVLGGCLLLVVFGVFVGISIQAEQLIANGVKTAFEILSYFATAVAAVVAVVALSDWRTQFKHAERFNSIKDLRRVADDLRLFTKYVKALERKYLFAMTNAGASDAALNEQEEAARVVWVGALQNYGLAWATASVFFSVENESLKKCHPTSVASLFYNETMRLTFQYANNPTKDDRGELILVAREISEKCKFEVASIHQEIEALLRLNA